MLGAGRGNIIFLQGHGQCYHFCLPVDSQLHPTLLPKNIWAVLTGLSEHKKIKKIKKGVKFGGSMLETLKRSVGWEKIMD